MIRAIISGVAHCAIAFGIICVVAVFALEAYYEISYRRKRRKK